MFGDVLEKKQKETTPLNPQSPYAISKVFLTLSRLKIIETLMECLPRQAFCLIMSHH